MRLTEDREIDQSRLDKVLQKETLKLLKAVKKALPYIRDRHAGKEVVGQMTTVAGLLNRISSEERKKNAKPARSLQSNNGD